MELMIILSGIFLLTFVWWFFISSTEVKEELNEVKEKALALPSSAELKKMTKPQLKALVEELGVNVDTKKVKKFIVEDLEELRSK